MHHLKLFFSTLTLTLAIFLAPLALAQEATTTPEIIPATTATTTPPVIETATTTSSTTTPPVPEPIISLATTTTDQVIQVLPLDLETDIPAPTIIERIIEVVKEVPVYLPARAFDVATAPGKVHLSVLMPDGTAPTVSVFTSFVGVGGKTFGGPLDKEGAITVTMPQGRYYAEFLVIDTRYGPPNDPPSFFLDANEEQTFGPLLLSGTSSFTDSALEAEVAETLKDEKSGFAKIFSLIIKLLLAILQEIRGLRSDLISGGIFHAFM